MEKDSALREKVDSALEAARVCIFAQQSIREGGMPFTPSLKTWDEGIKTPTGLDKWSAQTVRNILMNEKYCGDLVLQKKYHSDYLSKKTLVNKGEKPKYKVTDAHDPIIDLLLLKIV